MCNLFSHTTNVQAIIDLVGALHNGVGSPELPQPNISPDYPAPIVRAGVELHLLQRTISSRRYVTSKHSSP
ncbi:putative SOS response-associated peptidase YedK [Ancylobacter sp. 3268]|nr:putative SOS response-associated peptidase YedK [Ancylobacter sp. 3268]